MEIVNEAVAEVKKIEGEVVAEVKKVEAVAERLVQELSAEEKLAIRDLENKYLKAQMEIQRLSKIVQDTQAEYTKITESLVKKYVIDPATWLFDNAELVFKKRQ